MDPYLDPGDDMNENKSLSLAKLFREPVLTELMDQPVGITPSLLSRIKKGKEWTNPQKCINRNGHDLLDTEESLRH